MATSRTAPLGRKSPPALLNRELSLLQFNHRVLSMAESAEVPLLERLRYICIVSSNLDEFFEVRMAPLHAAIAENQAGHDHLREEMERLAEQAHALIARQYAVFNQQVIPELAKQKILLLSHAERNAAQRKWVKDFFNREVRPLMMPVSLDPAHPFPQVANKSLNFIVKLKGEDAFGRSNPIAIVKVPRVLPRVIRLPESLSQGKQVFILLSSVLRAHLSDLFPGRKTEVFSQFRLTRDSDLWVDEQDVDNLRQALRTGLETRNFGHGVRLEVSNSCPDELATILLQQFNLNESSLYRVDGPVNLVRLNQLVDLAKATRLRFSSHTPAWPRALKRNQSLFAQIRRHDVLLHHPFESFDPVMELLREAVEDPDVLSIRQTIYRTGTQSKLMELLLEAVRRGKEVTVVVELKARFDEEVNINWAEKLENLGAQVVYGVVGLKTHAKMLLITRRERRALQHYVHLSTGNYNPQTARFYTDLGLLTAHPQIAEDVMHVFVHLASQVRLPKLHQLLVAPFDLHERMVQHIQEVERAARAGKPARIIAKMNTLTDEGLIQALMSCAQAGASVDLIVRGACQLPAGVPQLTQNIRVRSIVGRFLEHSRVFYFQADAAEYMYLSSADWMSRNMFRRMEVAWPIQDAKLRQRIMQEALQMYLHDDVSAWCLKAGGDYEKVSGPEHFSVQQALLEQYKTE